MYKEGGRSWRLRSGRATGLVFSHDGVTPLEYRAIQYRFDKAFERLGMPYSGAHILRHSFATDFLEKTGDHLALMKIMGHRDIRETFRYAKITDPTIQKGTDKYAESFRTQEDEVLRGAAE